MNPWESKIHSGAVNLIRSVVISSNSGDDAQRVSSGKVVAEGGLVGPVQHAQAYH